MRARVGQATTWQVSVGDGDDQPYRCQGQDRVMALRQAGDSQAHSPWVGRIPHRRGGFRAQRN
ncbi:hypothetical protein BN1263110050 [Stenotrophomonas indicatrix]|nr:hypothetical protein BN1263110050 [Stenotrophomonas indicatrix]